MTAEIWFSRKKPAINHNGYAALLNNEGELNIGATVVNNGGAVKDSTGNLDGGFYAISRTNGTGVNVTDTFNITGDGEVLIKNKTGANGLNYAQGATINTNGYQAALVNRNGAMNVAGNISADNIIVRSGTEADPSNSTFSVTGTLNDKDAGERSYIVNWYNGGTANAVNGNTENGALYENIGGGNPVEIRQQARSSIILGINKIKKVQNQLILNLFFISLYFIILFCRNCKFSQITFYKPVKITVHNRLNIPCFVPCSVIFYHFVRMENIRADL